MWESTRESSSSLRNGNSESKVGENSVTGSPVIFFRSCALTYLLLGLCTTATLRRCVGYQPSNRILHTKIMIILHVTRVLCAKPVDCRHFCRPWPETYRFNFYFPGLSLATVHIYLGLSLEIDFLNPMLYTDGHCPYLLHKIHDSSVLENKMEIEPRYVQVMYR